jgi:DNA-binding Lrp family transcriptional regulator
MTKAPVNFGVWPMDDTDRTILSLLASDARMSLATLALRLKLARSTVQARLERLEASGVIAGYTVRLGEAARAGRIRASVLLTVEPRAQPNILARLKAIAEVEAVHATSGRFDLLLQIAAPTTAALDQVLDQVGAMSGVRSSESLIHLSTKFDRAT